MVPSDSKPKPYRHPSRSTTSSSAGGAGLEKLKTVVRRLPPNLPEDVFWQSVQLWVTEETVTWKRFHPGKIRKRYNKENTPSRAYIAFKNADLLATFSLAYDGHLFRDKAGVESQAVVEFAPYQKVPTEKKKADARAGTIEQDDDYISFIASLNAPASKPSDSETIESLVASTHSTAEIKSTPLLEALLAEKSAARDKESILRNHAHYRDRDRDSKRERADARKGGKSAAAAVAHAGSGVVGGSGRGGARAGASIVDDSMGAGAGRRARRVKRGEEVRESAAGGAAGGGVGEGATPALTLAQLQSTMAASGPPPGLAPAGGRRERGQRERRRDAPTRGAVPNPAATATTQDSIATSTNPPSGAPPTATGATTSDPMAAAAATPPPSRRPRPTIGLQSRQFEAALSGVVPSGAGLRSPRRERERRGGAAAGTGTVAVEVGAAGTGTSIDTSASAATGEGGKSELARDAGGERKVSGGGGGRRGDRGTPKDTMTTTPNQTPKIHRRESISATNSPTLVTDNTDAAANDTRATSPLDAPTFPGARGGGGGGRGGERGRGVGRGWRRGRARGRGAGAAGGE